MTHPLLFEPFTVRRTTLRNRIVVSPMCQYMAIDGFVQDWHRAHHARLALGGPGAAVVEATAVQRIGRITHGCTGLWEDGHVTGMAEVAALYRRHGAMPGIQIGHAGRRACAQRPWDGARPLALAGTSEEPWQTVGPSAIPEREGHPVPRELTEAEIAAVVADFAAAAKRALRAGFEFIEIHGAHGYLVHSFFSPVSNRRTDRFGDSLENRMRFPLMVAEAVRSAWPEDRPLFYRASVVDGVEGGTTVEDTVALARALKGCGVDVIDCSSGGMSGPATLSTSRLAPGFQAPLAAAVREGAHVATMAVGAILDGPQAEAIIRDGKADLIAVGREFLADGGFVYRAAEALGLEKPWSVLPPQYAFYLERRAAVLDR